MYLDNSMRTTVPLFNSQNIHKQILPLKYVIAEEELHGFTLILKTGEGVVTEVSMKIRIMEGNTVY